MFSLSLLPFIAGGATLVVGTAIVRSRNSAKRRKRAREFERMVTTRQAEPARHPMPHIEHRLAETAFASIRKVYGEVFAGFSIFRIGRAVQMDLATKHEWRLIAPFYRNLALRHLWRGLVDLTRTKDVTIIVDGGSAQSVRWTAVETTGFNDRGIREPWAIAGRIGSLFTTPIDDLDPPPADGR